MQHHQLQCLEMQHVKINDIILLENLKKEIDGTKEIIT